MSYSPPPLVGRPPAVVLSPVSDEFAVARAIPILTTLSASIFPVGTGTWPSANKPVGVEFWIQEPLTIYQLGWINGSGTMTDSCDVGVYDASYARMISTGSTARSGANALQLVNVADTTIGPGRYRLVMSNSGTTASQQFMWTGPANAAVWGMVGLLDSATSAVPLPDPLTNMATAATFTFCPMMFAFARAVV